MISLFKYISAKRRLSSSLDTITMMGGEDNCDAMTLAQTEMIYNEVTYFYYQMWKEVIYILLLMFNNSTFHLILFLL
jgi:hypothetical protein